MTQQNNPPSSTDRDTLRVKQLHDISEILHRHFPPPARAKRFADAQIELMNYIEAHDNALKEQLMVIRDLDLTVAQQNKVIDIINQVFSKGETDD